MQYFEEMIVQLHQGPCHVTMGWGSFHQSTLLCDYDRLLYIIRQPAVQQTEEEHQANTGLLHPYSTVTASRNNNQLESGFMNKWSIPRRPYFPALVSSAELIVDHERS